MTSEPWAVRQKLDRADTATHVALLDAALTTFAEQGFARTTIADIARAAGTSRATFYVYFASKEEVFAAAAEQVRDRLLAAQELGAVDPDDVAGVARATNAAFLAVYAEHLRFLTVLAHQALADADMARLLDEITSAPMRRSARWIRRLGDRGLAQPAGTPETVALAGGGLIKALAPLWRERPDEREALIEELTRLYLRLLGVEL